MNIQMHCLQESRLSGLRDSTHASRWGRKHYCGGVEVTGKEMREIFDLPSTNFDAIPKKNTIVFNTKGYGHASG